MELKKICSWCGETIKDPPGATEISHGICGSKACLMLFDPTGAAWRNLLLETVLDMMMGFDSLLRYGDPIADETDPPSASALDIWESFIRSQDITDLVFVGDRLDFLSAELEAMPKRRES